MAFLDKLTNTLSAAGKDGLNKAKELKDTAKLSMDIKEREGAIQKYYRELGKAYYQDHKGDLSPEYEQVSEIRAAFEEIGELKATKDDVRGIKRCSSCGSVVTPGAKFCPNCGEKCETEPPREEESAKEPEAEPETAENEAAEPEAAEPEQESAE